jgi:hypothetical protein
MLSRCQAIDRADRAIFEVLNGWVHNRVNAPSVELRLASSGPPNQVGKDDT